MKKVKITLIDKYSIKPDVTLLATLSGGHYYINRRQAKKADGLEFECNGSPVIVED
jgi:hypothetical protein